MHKLFLGFVFTLFSASSVVASPQNAKDVVFITVNEHSFLLNDAKQPLTDKQLTAALKKLTFSKLHIYVHKCAGPVMVAQAYVAIKDAHPDTVDDVTVKAISDDETACSGL